MDGIPQNGRHLVAPGRREPTEHGDEIGGQDFPFPLRVSLKNVESDRMCFVRRIKDDDVTEAILWNHPEDCLGEITMRIKERDAPASSDVLRHEAKK